MAIGLSGGGRDSEPNVSYRSPDGAVHQVDLGEVRAEDLVAGSPWRAFRWRRGQQHYSGIYWSATTGAHVVYESRLELSRLILADFDPRTVRIAAQPFLVEQAGRRHVPDFLLVDVEGVVTVVNVKPADRLATPKVREALDWATSLFEARGWRSEVWSGAEPATMANVRFLAGYRRPEVLDAGLVTRVAEAVEDDDRIGDVEERLAPVDPSASRAAVLHLLWRGRLRADLSVPLERHSMLVRSA